MTSEELRTAYEMFKQIQFDSKTDEQRYNHTFYNHTMEETRHYLRFASWIKQSYPDVWEAWRAVEDIKNGV